MTRGERGTATTRIGEGRTGTMRRGRGTTLAILLLLRPATGRDRGPGPPAPMRGTPGAGGSTEADPGNTTGDTEDMTVVKFVICNI